MTLDQVLAAHPQLCAAGFRFTATPAERVELAAQTEQFAYCQQWLQQLEPGRSLLGAKPGTVLLKLAQRTAPCQLTLGAMVAAVIADRRGFRWKRDAGSSDIVVAAMGDFAGLKKRVR